MMREHLNIVIVNDYASVQGGAAQVALSSAIGLARRGHSVILLSGVGPVMPELEENGVTVDCLYQYDILNDPSPTRSMIHGLWNRSAARRMHALLESLDPRRTVVHIHSWTKSLSSSVIRAAIDRHFHVILSPHDYFAACPNGAFFNYPRTEPCLLKAMSFRCALTSCDRRSYVHKIWRVCRQLVQQRRGRIPGGIKHFAVLSDFSGTILRAYLPSQSRVYKVSNPVLVDRREATMPHLNSAFVAVGRLEPEKGPLLLAEAALMSDSEVHFYGDGPCLSEIQGVNPTAKMHGWVDHKQVINEMTSARVLVFPSVVYEVQPLVVLEAAALGIPTIVADHGSAREMISDGVTGLLFKGGDVHDLADKMRMMKDDELVKNMGLAAYERYWSKPSTIDTHVERLEEVYCQMLSLTSDRKWQDEQMGRHLLINATILNTPRMTGLGVYTHNLLSELLPLLCADNLIGSITLIGDRQRIAKLFGDMITQEKISVDHLAAVYPLIRLMGINRRVYAERAHREVLFYSPTHHGVVVRGVPQVITIHDLCARIFPGNYRIQSCYFKYYLPHVLSLTREVISVSRNTADDLKKYYRYVPATSIVYEGVRTDLDSEPPIAVSRLEGERFFLFIGPSFNYKNADRLIDAFASLRGQHEERRDRLVFTGGRRPYVDELKNHICSTCPRLRPDIMFLGYVSKEELAWLYQHAVAAMVTTLYEGFGLPALEAMHFGCPVVASKVASLPEVCADAVIYVNPNDVHDISVAMFRVATDQALRAILIEKGHSNVKRFSWNIAAERVLQVLKRVACERA